MVWVCMRLWQGSMSACLCLLHINTYELRYKLAWLCYLFTCDTHAKITTAVYARQFATFPQYKLVLVFPRVCLTRTYLSIHSFICYVRFATYVCSYTSWCAVFTKPSLCLKSESVFLSQAVDILLYSQPQTCVVP